MQHRIVQFVKQGAWRKAKRLSYLLTRSFSARALAVKRVTDNKGRNTAGIDGARCQTQAELIARLNPVLRGWANYHRHVNCGKAYAQVQHHVWRQLIRWDMRRHPSKNVTWLAQTYFTHEAGNRWLFTDKLSGNTLVRLNHDIETYRHIKIRGHANPFDLEWQRYFREREKSLKMRASNRYIGKVIQQQNGLCLRCKQLIQQEDNQTLLYRDGNSKNRRLDNVLLIHQNCNIADKFNQ